jgi:predicted nucleic acid-binding protein
MDAVLPFPLRTKILGRIHVCRDPNDDMVLECAVVSGAQFIVTGDKDLLVLNPYSGIQIVTPAEFLAETA